MNARGLLPGEHAVLGLLGIRPMHGYEMSRQLQAEDVAAVCPVEQAMLYTYLRNLEARGLVRWDERRVGNRPPRKHFELTNTGRAELERWLQAPVARIREVRVDFLLKLYFLRQTNPDAERSLVQRQMIECRRYLQRLGPVPSEGGFGRLVVMAKRSAAEATLAWLEAYAGELAEAEAGAR
jgi:PadR family transcriptional regulator AphA